MTKVKFIVQQTKQHSVGFVFACFSRKKIPLLCVDLEVSVTIRKVCVLKIGDQCILVEIIM